MIYLLTVVGERLRIRRAARAAASPQYVTCTMSGHSWTCRCALCRHLVGAW